MVNAVISVVEERTFGSELSAAALAAATSIFVEDPTEFEYEGGTLLIGTEEHEYTAVDEDTGEITLSGTLAGAFDAAEPVYLFPLTVERVAHVTIEGEEEELEARVPHSLYDKLDVGIREGIGETVQVEFQGDELVVLDVLGDAPAVDGGFTMPGTITGAALEAVMVLTSALVAGSAGAARVEVGYGVDEDGNLDTTKIGIRAYGADGVTTTLSVDALTGEVYVKGRLDFGTGSRLLSEDIVELQEVVPAIPEGFQEPALVQKTARTFTDPEDTTLTIPWLSPTTQGNLLIAVVVIASPASGLTINTPAGWTAGSANLGGFALGLQARWFYISNAGSRSGNQAFSFTGGIPNPVGILMFEVSGAEVLDASGSDTGTGTSGTTGVITASATVQETVGFGIFAQRHSEDDEDIQVEVNGGAAITATQLHPSTVWDDFFDVDDYGDGEITVRYKHRDTSEASTTFEFTREFGESVAWIGMGGVFQVKPFSTGVGIDPPESGKVRLYSKGDGFGSSRLYSLNSNEVENDLNRPHVGRVLKDRIWLYTDCTSSAASASQGFDEFGSGTGAGVIAGSSEANHPGVLELETGTTAGGDARLTADVWQDNGEMRFGAWIKTPGALSTAAQRYNIVVGLNIAGGDQVVVRYSDAPDSGTANIWQLTCRTSGVGTSNDPLNDSGGSITVAANTWYYIEMVLKEGAVDVYIDGDKKVTGFTSNVPTAVSGLTGVRMLKSVGTLNRALKVDAIYLDHIFEGTR